jgi:hypothetical protein
MKMMLRDWLLTVGVEAESKEASALTNAPEHTVLSMTGLTSPVWTVGMFQMVSGESWKTA